MRARAATPLCAIALTLALLAGSARADAPQAAPSASGASSAPPPAAAPANDLQSPAQRSTRYSAYSLPAKMASTDIGVLGISGDDIYGRLGVAYGLNHGFQLDLNIAHWIAGLLGLNAKWSFFESKHAALAANLGVIYAHGSWLWLLSDFAQGVVSDSDLIAFPVSVVLSVPVNHWLQFDVDLRYQYAQVWGSVGDGATFYADTQVGGRQLILRPTLRLYPSDAVAFEFTTRLPLYNRVPYESDSTVNLGRGYSRSRDGWASVDFSEGWLLEFGVRSRVRRWLFATTRLAVGQLAKHVYGSVIYPSFNLEFRFP